MTDAEKEELLNECINKCAAFEKRTGIKTSELEKQSQTEFCLSTGLKLKEVKEWVASSRTALEIVNKTYK